jgi:hypothetical protein
MSVAALATLAIRRKLEKPKITHQTRAGIRRRPEILLLPEDMRKQSTARIVRQP